MAFRPYRQGLEPIFFDGTGPLMQLQAMSLNSLLQRPANPGSFNQFSSLDAPPNRHQNQRYSAAAINFGLISAANSMKSEIRGTISERNREPLNTP